MNEGHCKVCGTRVSTMRLDGKLPPYCDACHRSIQSHPARATTPPPGKAPLPSLEEALDEAEALPGRAERNARMDEIEELYLRKGAA
jgi:hypothetical protein